MNEFIFPKQNEFSIRINLMGKSGAGKSGLLAAAFPGALWLGPNPEGIRMTARKVAGYLPDVVRVSQVDPYSYTDALKRQVWNIVEAKDGKPIVDEFGNYNPIYTSHPENLVDGKNIVLTDMDFGWWSFKNDTFIQNYSALIVDDIDISMRAALDKSLRDAGVNAESNKRDPRLQGPIYKDYRVYYEPVLRDFDELAKSTNITVGSTTKVTINDKNSQGKAIKYMPDFGSEAFDEKAAFFSNLEVNWFIDPNADPTSIIDVPSTFGVVGRRHQATINTDPNDKQYFIKNRFTLSVDKAPANVRCIMAADEPKYNCPRLAEHLWADEMMVKVSTSLKQLSSTKPTNENIKKVWDEMAGIYFKPEYLMPGCPKDTSGIQRFHSPYFSWAFRDGLHKFGVDFLIDKQYGVAFNS